MGIFPTQGLNPGLPHCRWILYQLSHKGSPRILKWVAYPFSRESSQPRVSCIAGRFFTNWAIREAPKADRSSQKSLEPVGHGSEPDRHLLGSFATLQMLLVLQNWAPLTFHLWDFPVCGFDTSRMIFLCSGSRSHVSAANFPTFSISGTSASFSDSLACSDFCCTQGNQEMPRTMFKPFPCSQAKLSLLHLKYCQ